MKKMIIIALLGTVSLGTQAQTNRNFKTDMSTDRIYQMERTGSANDVDNTRVNLNSGVKNQETEELVKYQNESLQMNQTQQFQGNKVEQVGPNHTWRTIDRGDLPYHSVPYDTTKNNGHCLGCGSGTMTDPHLWKW